MKRILSALLCAAITQAYLPAAVRGDRAMYMGGTVPQLEKGVQGEINLDAKDRMEFVSKGGTFAIAYSDITNLEVGQKVGYRVGLTVALGVTTMGLMALPVLLAKKKKHYLTINYMEDGKDTGVMVLELAKDIAQTTTAVIEARSGKKTTVQGQVAEHAPLMAKIDHTPLSNRTAVPEVVKPVEVPASEVKAAPKPERQTQLGEFRAKIYGLE